MGLHGLVDGPVDGTANPGRGPIRSTSIQVTIGAAQFVTGISGSFKKGVFCDPFTQSHRFGIGSVWQLGALKVHGIRGPFRRNETLSGVSFRFSSTMEGFFDRFSS